jgi:Uncharacterized protein involved in exopolysaccharide biosynthesis
MNVVWCPRAPLPSVIRMRRIGILGSVLVATLLLAGCSAGGGAMSSSPDEAGPVPQGVEAPGFAADAAEEDAARRAEIVTGWMTVTAEDPAAAAKEAVRLVEASGGRVDGRTEYAPANGDKGSASLTLRIPADRLQGVIDDLAELGRADEISTSSTDVTVAVADLESRIATQRGIIDRLNALFARAESIGDLVELEERIAQHQATLEELEAQQRSVADQVALSTLSLSIRSEAQAPEVAPMDFLSGLSAGWAGFVAFFSGLLVALGVLLPWLVFAGIVSAAIVLLVRWNRRRTATPEA